MDKFRKDLQKRQGLQVSGLVIANAAVMLTRNFNKTTIASMPVQGFVKGFQLGILAILVIILVNCLIRIIAAMRDPERLKKLYISETDERRLLIKQKSGSVGMNLVLYGLTAGTAVAGNFNDTIFFTLLGASLFAAFIRAFLKLYYHYKY